MTYESKIAQARELLEQHNSAAGKDGSVDLEAFFERLKKVGGTTEEMLAECTWEDLQDCGLPRILARRVARVFRAEDETEGPVKLEDARAMRPEALVDRYDPTDATNPVALALKEKVGDKRCIVFDDGGCVNVTASTTLVRELLDNYPEREVFDGRTVYRIGERPDQLADENPLYSGRMLRPDGSCDETSQSWHGVPLAVRQVVYLARAETREIVVSSVDDAHRAIELARQDDALAAVRRRYPKASALYEKLHRQRRLPSLVIDRSEKARGQLNNPWSRNRTF